MPKKRRFEFGRSILKGILLASNISSLVGKIGSLIKLEARLAKKSLVTISLMLIFVSVLLLTIWFCLLGMLYLYLITIPWSPLLSLFVIFLINIFFLIICLIIVMRSKRDLTFPATRRLLEFKSTLLKELD